MYEGIDLKFWISLINPTVHLCMNFHQKKFENNLPGTNGLHAVTAFRFWLANFTAVFLFRPIFSIEFAITNWMFSSTEAIQPRHWERFILVPGEHKSNWFWYYLSRTELKVSVAMVVLPTFPKKTWESSFKANISGTWHPKSKKFC